MKRTPYIFGIVMVACLFLVSSVIQAGGFARVRFCNSCNSFSCNHVLAFNSAVVAVPIQNNVVSVVPVATQAYAVDAASYQWRVNQEYQQFKSWSDYMKQKYDAQLSQSAPKQQQSAAPPQQPQEQVTLNTATIKAVATEVLAIMKQEGIIITDSNPVQAEITPKPLPPLPDGTKVENMIEYHEPNERVASLLQNKCISCHQQGHNPKKNVAFFDDSGNILSPLPVSAIMKSVTNPDPKKRMPPKGPLDQQELLELASWAESK